MEDPESGENFRVFRNFVFCVLIIYCTVLHITDMILIFNAISL